MIAPTVVAIPTDNAIIEFIDHSITKADEIFKTELPPPCDEKGCCVAMSGSEHRNAPNGASDSFVFVRRFVVLWGHTQTPYSKSFP